MFISGVGTGGTLPDLISTMVTEVLSKIKGGALALLGVQVRVGSRVASSSKLQQEFLMLKYK